VLLSVLIPLLQCSEVVSSHINSLQSAVGMPTRDISQLMQRGFQWDWVAIVTTIYWSGVMVFAAIFLLQILSLLSLYIRSKSASILGYRIRTVQEKLQPFSFFKSIFINPASHTVAEQVFILKHEAVHTRQWHSLDIIIGEIKRIFCWFNPASWLILGAIRENLEYIADRKVLQRGVNAKEYQYALLAVKQQQQRNTLTNNFNFSHLKLRITMMNKSKSSDLHLVKYLAIVPVVAIASIVTNYAHAQKIDLKPVEAGNVSSQSLSNKKIDLSQQSANQNQSAILILADEKVVDESVPKINEVQTAPTVETLILKAAGENGNQLEFHIPDGTKISADKFLFEPLQENSDSHKPKQLRLSIVESDIVYFVDGVEVESMEGIEPADIESIEILKGEHARAIKPALDNAGIISIKTRSNALAGARKAKIATPIATHSFDATIYPNPATSSVQIKVNSNDPSNSYQMYDRHGKMVAEGKLNANTKISTEGMDTGTYFIKMEIEGTSKEGKVELIK